MESQETTRICHLLRIRFLIGCDVNVKHALLLVTLQPEFLAATIHVIKSHLLIMGEIPENAKAENNLGERSSVTDHWYPV